MTTALQTQDRVDISDLLKGTSLKPDVFMNIVERQWNDNLSKCSPASFVKAVRGVAALALNPDPIFQQIYLIPYEGQVTLQISYKGWISLTSRAGVSISAEVAYENDEFTYQLGSHTQIVHVKKLVGDRGNPIATWATAEYEGRSLSVVLTEDEIKQIEAKSPSHKKDSSPWKHWRDEMRKKSAIKRLAKLIPVSDRTAAIARALQMDDVAEERELNQPPAGRTRAEQTKSKLGIVTLDQVRGKVQAATDADSLEDAISDVEKLSEEDKATIRGEYMKKKKELKL